MRSLNLTTKGKYEIITNLARGKVAFVIMKKKRQPDKNDPQLFVHLLQFLYSFACVFLQAPLHFQGACLGAFLCFLCHWSWFWFWSLLAHSFARCLSQLFSRAGLWNNKNAFNPRRGSPTTFVLHLTDLGAEILWGENDGCMMVQI